MKSLIIYALGVVFIFQSVSCKKSKTVEGNNIFPWKWKQSSSRIKSSYVENGTILFSQDTTYLFTHGEYMTFNSDGTYISGSDTSAQTNSGKYLLENNKITLISSYTVNNQLQYDTIKCDILSISSNNLTFYNSKSDVISPGVYNSEMWINLTK